MAAITGDTVTVGNLDTTGGGGAGDIFVTANNGGLVVRDIDAGMANVELTAGDGSIADDMNDATRITAANLIMTASAMDAAIGATGATNEIDTTLSGMLTASATDGAGGIFVSDNSASGLTATSVDAGATSGDIELTATMGDLTVGAITAGTADVKLTATVGSIVDDGNGQASGN